MNREELLKVNADLIGVSYSERELAFQILTEKISEQLREDGDAVKIEELGVFQLKQDIDKSELIFSPIRSTSKTSSKTLFIRIPISKRTEDDSDDIFSVSVGKPTIPLNYSSKSGEEADTSFLFIKKKIEERVTDILDSADYIKDFNLWDEYLKSSPSSSEQKMDDSELLQTLSEPDPEPEEDNFDFPNVPIRETIEFETEDEKPDEIEDDIFRDLETFKNLSDENTDEVNDEVSPDHDDAKTDSEYDLSTFEKINEDEKVENDNKDEDEYEDKDVFNLDDSIFHEPESDRDKVDWSWGDELKDEFKNDSEEEHGEIKPEKTDPNEKKSDKKIDEDPFGTLEKTLAGDEEFRMLTGEHEFTEEERPIDQEVRITNLDKPRPIPPRQTRMTRMTQEELEGEEEPKRSTKEYKSFRDTAAGSSIFVISGIVIILAAIIYFAFSLSGEPDKSVLKPTRTEPVETIQQEVSSTVGEQTETSTGIQTTQEQVTRQSASDVSSGSSEVEEVRVSNLIFRRGNKYNVQVSSWRSSVKANDEVKRLRSQGYDAFVVQAYLPSKGGTWHRVRIGGFNSVDEARNFLNTNQF